MEITKEMIEKELGYEINKFKLEPLYKDGECIGLNVKVEPKAKVEFINTTINTTIKKELYSEIEYLIIMWNNDGTKTAGVLTRQIMELIDKEESK
jgi:hypothetical protein